MYSRWEKLRWELTTSQLLALAKLLCIDVSDISPPCQKENWLRESQTTRE